MNVCRVLRVNVSIMLLEDLNVCVDNELVEDMFVIVVPQAVWTTVT